MNTVTVSTGRGHPINEGPEVFGAIGSDYLRRLSPRWEVGIQFDWNFSESFGEFEGIAVVPIVAYSITDRFPVFGGIGAEHDLNHSATALLVRLGGEYTFYLGRAHRFAFLPGGFVDYIEQEFLVSGVLALGVFF
jgi:hypothetical protein